MTEAEIKALFSPRTATAAINLGSNATPNGSLEMDGVMVGWALHHRHESAAMTTMALVATAEDHQ